MAQRLSAAGPKARLLLRLDSGFDAAALMDCVESMNPPADPEPTPGKPVSPGVDWIIKWNPRQTDLAELAAQRDAQNEVAWEHPRVGKRLITWEQPVPVPEGQRPRRRILRLV